MTVGQGPATNNRTLITLVPRQAALVAVLETNAQTVSYTEKVILDATASYDPDDVQVGSLQFMQHQTTRSHMSFVTIHMHCVPHGRHGHTFPFRHQHSILTILSSRGRVFRIPAIKPTKMR